MPVDALQSQLASARQRFTMLQRRSSDMPDTAQAKILSRALRELEAALEEVQVAQEQLIDSRARMETLQAELAQERDKYWRLFDEMPQAYLVTRVDSAILEANRAASELLNVSQRFLIGKTLSVFVSEDRGGFLRRIANCARAGVPLELNLAIRPRERALITVQARVTATDGTLRWVITPVGMPAGEPAQAM